LYIWCTEDGIADGFNVSATLDVGSKDGMDDGIVEIVMHGVEECVEACDEDVETDGICDCCKFGVGRL